MADAIILKTGMKYENGRASCILSGHVDLHVAGMATIAERPDAWSPVHLLVSAAESCFFLTLQAMAEKMRIGIEGYASSAEGKLENTDDTHKEITEIVIRPTVRLKNEDDRPKLPKLFQMVEEHCYVARSLKTKIKVEGGVR